MTDNPYQSPLSAEQAAAPSADFADADRRGAGPFFMAVIGALLGSVLIAAAGGLCGYLFSVAFLGIYPQAASSKEWFAIVWATDAAIFSGIGGAVFGAAVGFVSGFCRASSRRRFVLGTTIAMAVLGGTIGAFRLAAAIDGWSWFYLELARPRIVEWSCAGLLVGGVVGAAVGWLLGKLLANICWGRSIAQK